MTTTQPVSLSERKHTPGPWEYSSGKISIMAPTGLVAQFWTRPILADFHLMIAAPDMYEALKLCAPLVHGPASTACTMALAKAEGRTP